jgi:hypothetical protein
MRLRKFDPEDRPAIMFLIQLFGITINATDLVSLVETCSGCLDREAKRKKSALLKWFGENLQQIGPFLREHVEIAAPPPVMRNRGCHEKP